jgi:Tfp pilus assembly protein PilO
MLDNLSKRERHIAYIATAIIVSGLLYVLAIGPFMARLNTVNEKIEATKLDLEKSLALMQVKKDIDSEFSLYADRLKIRGGNEQEMTHILNELESIARESGVKIVSIRPKPAEEKDYYRRFEVEIETESQMSSLMSFIYYLKNSSQLIKVDKLNLNTGSVKSRPMIRTVMVVSKIALD